MLKAQDVIKQSIENNRELLNLEHLRTTFQSNALLHQP